MNGDADVLIVGAGPTGLVLALWLSHMGVRVRIVDQDGGARDDVARAGRPGAHAGAVPAVRAGGRRRAARAARRGHQPVGARREARAGCSSDRPGTGISPYPYATIFPQDEHERLLIERLASRGVTVERGTRLLSFEARAGGVIAHLQRARRSATACRAAYMAGCDGARSVVRKAIGADFPGGTYDHLFYVADVDGATARSWTASCTWTWTRPTSSSRSRWHGRAPRA